MTALVTGATGLVGINLVRALAAHGVQVRALVRPRSDTRWIQLPNVEIVTGDVTEPATLAPTVKGCAHVYHLAGWVRLSPWGWKQARRVNVEGTRLVCAACVEHGARMVHVSSIATVGGGSLDACADERTPWDWQRLNAPYYQTKYDAERVVLQGVAAGLDAVIVNPAYIIGPYDTKPTSGRFLLQIARRRVPVYPLRGGTAFVDVRDVVGGLRSAARRGESGERYILAGDNVSYAEFVRRVARLAGVPAPRWGVARAHLAPAAWLATQLGRVFTNRFADHNSLVLDIAFTDHYVTAAKAHAALGFRTRPLDESIADTLAWFRQSGMLR